MRAGTRCFTAAAAHVFIKLPVFVTVGSKPLAACIVVLIFCGERVRKNGLESVGTWRMRGRHRAGHAATPDTSMGVMGVIFKGVIKRTLFAQHLYFSTARVLTKAHRNAVLPVGPVVLAQHVVLLPLPLTTQELLAAGRAGTPEHEVG